MQKVEYIPTAEANPGQQLGAHAVPFCVFKSNRFLELRAAHLHPDTTVLHIEPLHVPSPGPWLSFAQMVLTAIKKKLL